jgi:hypothetical protein
LSSITRRTAFWIAYAVISAIALVVAARLFPLAIPLVNLDVKLSRGEAIAQAEALAARLKLAPADARIAARFNHDGATQNYVELEGGGRPAFAELTRGDVYAPYWWDVRLFTLGSIDETVIRFRPDGAPNGFARRVAETYVRDPATKALPVATARALAEERAHDDWGIDFARYRFLEQSQQTQKNDRVDHSFVYERPEQLGEARVRLRLVVAGDELMAVMPFVFIPEAFGRRFQELRSANNLIANIASASAGVLYGLGGTILGVLWLLRRHWLVWRPAFIAGLIVGGLMAIANLASTPAAWFGADTTETTTTFWLKQAAAAIFLFTASGLGYALAFMAAESLARRAFPRHPQLWRIWSREAGATKQIAGRTLGGYLFVPLELALVMLFYYATNRWLGWWQPSEMLSDPNILSSAVPALSPIAISLQAGFMEECVFRAIPLALGALIGARYGRRRLGIALAFVLQALVFGGAHANYPGFPSYSRLVELIVPSMIWALIFLRFGLLPTILLHTVFDLTLFSIPVFLVDAPGAFVQQALIIAAGLVPLAIILWRRVRAGAWRELPDALRNGAWRPLVPEGARTPAAVPSPAMGVSAPAVAFQRALPLLGVAGLAAWLLFTPFRADAPSLPIDRDAAIAIADRALAEHGVKLPADWRKMATVRLANDDGEWTWHKFVWREAGPDAYRALIGAALAPPVWDVRYATFDGDVAERAEEWRVSITGDGGVRTFRHALPEARPGAKLTKDAALALAERELRVRFGLDPATLKQVSADEKHRGPESNQTRTDWSFTFADPSVNVGKDGELRYVVIIAGDEIVGAGRMIFVPEAWQRTEQERDNRLRIVKISSGIAFFIAGLAAVVLGVIGWTHGRCDARAVKWVAALSFVVALLTLANTWPMREMGLTTTEPITSQWLMLLVGAVVGGLFVALLFGLTSGIGAWYARSATRFALAGALPPWAAAVAAGLFVAGLEATFANLWPRTAPLWPPLQAMSLWSPVAGAVLGGLGFIAIAGIALFVLYLVARLTHDWTRRQWVGVAVVVLLQTASTLGLAGSNLAGAAAVGVTIGLATAAVLWLLLRFDPTTIPAFSATGLVLATLLRAVQIGTPSAYASGTIAIAVTLAMAWLVTRYLRLPLAPAMPVTAVAASPSTG